MLVHRPDPCYHETTAATLPGPARLAGYRRLIGSGPTWNVRTLGELPFSLRLALLAILQEKFVRFLFVLTHKFHLIPQTPAN